jgi:hypothetical protein
MLPRPRGDGREAVLGLRTFAAAARSQLGIWEEAVDEKVPWISTGLGLVSLGWRWRNLKNIFLKKTPSSPQ